MASVCVQEGFGKPINTTSRVKVRTRIKCNKFQRAITQKKLSDQELWFLCTAFPLIDIYQCLKFQVYILNMLRVKVRTRIKWNTFQRAITQKLSDLELRFLCTAIPLNDIYQCLKFPFYIWNMLRVKVLQKLNVTNFKGQ